MGKSEDLGPRTRRRGFPALIAMITMALCVATAASAASFTGGGSSTPAADPGPGVTWPSGAYCGSSNPACTLAFAAWRGRPVEATTTFTGKDTWAGLEGPDGWLSDWSRSPYKSVVVVTVPMLPTVGDANDPTPTLAEEATGAYNSHFVTVAQRLISAGMGSVTIRLGHELNGTWYSWSARSDPDSYAAAWRQIVTAIRAVPGAHFTFDWNVAVGSGINSFDARRAYPGDDYVDTIGEDVYDVFWGRKVSPEVRWSALVNPAGAVPQGLQFWADFAAAHGKPNSFAEWGLVGAGAGMAAGGEGGDDPYFIQQMHTWFATHPTAFEIYFNRNPSDGAHRIDSGQFPQSAQTYLELFGAGGASPSDTPSVSATPSSSGPCDGTADLLVSTSPDRSNAVPLCGATLSGSVYVFARTTNATSASFFVDNPGRERAPTTLDLGAPYDLAGTSADGTAKPWELSGETPGDHTVTVLLPSSHGTQLETATFTVSSP